MFKSFNLKVTYPLDMIKTRLQIQDELMKKDKNLKDKNLPRGMFGIGINIGKS